MKAGALKAGAFKVSNNFFFHFKIKNVEQDKHFNRRTNSIINILLHTNLTPNIYKILRKTSMLNNLKNPYYCINVHR